MPLWHQIELPTGLRSEPSDISEDQRRGRNPNPTQPARSVRESRKDRRTGAERTEGERWNRSRNHWWTRMMLELHYIFMIAPFLNKLILVQRNLLPCSRNKLRKFLCFPFMVQRELWKFSPRFARSLCFTLSFWFNENPDFWLRASREAHVLPCVFGSTKFAGFCARISLSDLRWTLILNYHCKNCRQFRTHGS